MGRMLQALMSPPDDLQQESVCPWAHVGAGVPLGLGRAVAARTMETVAMMDVNCILTECLEDGSLESFGSCEGCLESC